MRLAHVVGKSCVLILSLTASCKPTARFGSGLKEMKASSTSVTGLSLSFNS